jgi:hypothetical protein
MAHKIRHTDYAVPVDVDIVAVWGVIDLVEWGVSSPNKDIV